MPTYSGLFNTASPLLCGTAKLIYTWNARALICVDPSTQARKMNIIDKILKHAAVLCLQEVHGTEAELRKSSINTKTPTLSTILFSMRLLEAM
jgi:hypothetical protein